MDLWLDKMQHDFNAIPEKQRAFIPGMPEKMTKLRNLTANNYAFLKLIVADHMNVFQNQSYEVTKVPCI